MDHSYSWPTKETDEQLAKRIRKMRDSRYPSVYKRKVRAKTKKARSK